MESSKSTILLLICMLFISSATPILGCGSCGGPYPPKHPVKPPGTLPPIPKLPPITVPTIPKLPPVTVPKVPIPPVTVPKVPVLPPVTVPKVPPPVTVPKVPILPPVTVPPVTVPKVPIPPVTVPKVPVLPPVTVPKVPVLPPVVTNPPGVPCPTPPTTTPVVQPTCPIDTLKLGACVDLIGGLIHIGLGDPVVNECCPVLAGLVELEAAVCLCTTLKLSVLNLNIYVPLALQLLVTCGKSPPPGYTCTL